MSKGHRIVTFRIDSDAWGRIVATVDKANANRASEPYTTTSWIRSCIAERLDKPARAARAARKRSIEKRSNADGLRLTDSVSSD